MEKKILTQEEINKENHEFYDPEFHDEAEWDRCQQRDQEIMDLEIEMMRFSFVFRFLEIKAGKELDFDREFYKYEHGNYPGFPDVYEEREALEEKRLFADDYNNECMKEETQITVNRGNNQKVKDSILELLNQYMINYISFDVVDDFECYLDEIKFTETLFTDDLLTQIEKFYYREITEFKKNEEICFAQDTIEYGESGKRVKK
ncbi:MAG: hypothetical protein ABSD71_14885 [Bacteroidales bacterium]|jgi:hypothetical protein